jgi:outer membrane receptor protein involved in Fe transport
MRAPTPIELTCADPTTPCRLPNNFLADPPLEKVVSKTLETGARGKVSERLGWSLGLYNTDLNDDIQFISAGAGAINAGFFQNVGKTRRRGAEAGLQLAAGPWTFLANYSFVRATFESSFLVTSPSKSSAADLDGDGEVDDIQVSPGNRIPGIPEHAFKLRAEYSLFEKLAVGANLNYFSSQYARGDENNQDVHGRIPGYSLVNLDARYQASNQLQVFARIQNVFDRKYETLGVLGENVFPGGVFDPANEVDEQFRSVGAPRAAWIGLKYQFAK